MDYYYKCSTCGKTFDKQGIEENLIYLCPDCKYNERNEPLKGVLLVEYDYSNLRKILTEKQFLNLNSGDYESYKSILPLAANYPAINIKLNPTLERIKFDGKNIGIFNDTLNPTLSYKDRASLLVCIKAMELGITDIAAASTGNAGSSLAGIAAKLGLKSHIFVPKRIPVSKRLQIQSYGANIYLVDGSYDDAFDLCNIVASQKKWYNRNTALNPMTIEGKKTAAFDLFILSKGKLPKTILVPVGDGVIISGLYKGFYDLVQLGLIETIPRLIAVQAKGSNALIRFIQDDKLEFNQTNTIADSIDAGAPRNLYLAAAAVKQTAGVAVDVEDEDILAAQKILAASGILCEPSSASVLAAYVKLQVGGYENILDDVLLLITGNGLKDTKSLEKWNAQPESKTFEYWTDFFDNN